MNTLCIVLLSVGGLWILFVLVRWIFKTSHDVARTTKHTLDIEKSIEKRGRAIDAATEEYLRKSQNLNEDNFNRGKQK